MDIEGNWSKGWVSWVGFNGELIEWDCGDKARGLMKGSGELANVVVWKGNENGVKMLFFSRVI